MYSFEWNKNTGGYKLKPKITQYVANEIRPVFAQELLLLGMDKQFIFDMNETEPFLWARKNIYFDRGGEIIAKLEKFEYGKPPAINYLEKAARTLVPVDIESLIAENKEILNSLVNNTLKRIKEMYDKEIKRCDFVYIGFSGGKDSVVLLDLCHRVLPLSVPVIFCDTDMELPDTYLIWDEIQKHYPDRKFYKVKAEVSAIDNWKIFGPPSQNLRWCCSVHKSTPAVLFVKKMTGNNSVKILSYIGVRAEESSRRNGYEEDIGIGVKNFNQANAMPLLQWGAHELFLYIFSKQLLLNTAYRVGIPRVGCLLCPMTTQKQAYLLGMNYSEQTKFFSDIIKNEITRDFVSEEDFNMFIFSGGWHARKSGVSLKNVISSTAKKTVDNKIIYYFANSSKLLLFEWIKAIGNIIKTSEDSYTLVAKNKTFHLQYFIEESHSQTLKVSSSNGSIPSDIAKNIRFAINKSIACSVCRTCQAECPVGAISFAPKVNINQERCIHCLKCYNFQEGCLRFYSKRYAGGTTMKISGINKYLTFGLKPEWISVLILEKEGFRSTSALGNRQIPSAVTWFREAGLITADTVITPKKLLSLGEKKGITNNMLWHIVWNELSTNSPLVKWYICNTKCNIKATKVYLLEILQDVVTSDSVRRGALTSLCALIKNSPIGTDDESLVQVETKGNRVLSLTRIPRNVEPLVVLYGLYLMSEKADIAEFTISQLMTANFESKCISPLVAFGMSVTDFKSTCLGLMNKYPDFIHCSFTHGLEDIRIKKDSKTIDDVVELMLK